MLRKLFSHTAIYGLAPHVSKFASFFVLPLVTQHLTGIDYGVYGVVTAAIGLLSVFASLGLRLILVNSFYKSPQRYPWLWRRIYGFLTLWSIPYALLTALLLYFIVPHEAKGNIALIIFLNVGPLVFFGQTTTLATTYYQVNKKPVPIAVRTIIFGLLTVALNWYTIAVLKLGYMGWFWSTFIASMLSNASYWWHLNIVLRITPILQLRWRSLRQNLRVTMPTIPHYYSGYMLNTSDKLLMEFIQVDAMNIGKYNVAYTFGNYFNALGIAAGLAVGPLLNECFKAGEEIKARSLVYIQQTGFFILTFFLCIWMKELFAFFIRNDELSKMYPLGIIIVMGYNYRPMYIGSNAKLMYVEKTKLLWRVSFIAGVLNVVLNLIFIPLFGYQAAAYTTFVSLLYMGYAGFFFREFRQHTSVAYHPIGWLAATIVLTIIAAFAVELNLIAKIILSAASILPSLIIIKKLNDRTK